MSELAKMWMRNKPEDRGNYAGSKNGKPHPKSRAARRARRGNNGNPSLHPNDRIVQGRRNLMRNFSAGEGHLVAETLQRSRDLEGLREGITKAARVIQPNFDELDTQANAEPETLEVQNTYMRFERQYHQMQRDLLEAAQGKLAARGEEEARIRASLEAGRLLELSKKQRESELAKSKPAEAPASAKADKSTEPNKGQTAETKVIGRSFGSDFIAVTRLIVTLKKELRDSYFSNVGNDAKPSAIPEAELPTYAVLADRFSQLYSILSLTKTGLSAQSETELHKTIAAAKKRDKKERSQESGEALAGARLALTVVRQGGAIKAANTIAVEMRQIVSTHVKAEASEIAKNLETELQKLWSGTSLADLRKGSPEQRAAVDKLDRLKQLAASKQVLSMKDLEIANGLRADADARMAYRGQQLCQRFTQGFDSIESCLQALNAELRQSKLLDPQWQGLAQRDSNSPGFLGGKKVVAVLNQAATLINSMNAHKYDAHPQMVLMNLANQVIDLANSTIEKKANNQLDPYTSASRSIEKQAQSYRDKLAARNDDPNLDKKLITRLIDDLDMQVLVAQESETRSGAAVKASMAAKAIVDELEAEFNMGPLAPSLLKRSSALAQVVAISEEAQSFAVTYGLTSKTPGVIRDLEPKNIAINEQSSTEDCKAKMVFLIQEIKTEEQKIRDSKPVDKWSRSTIDLAQSKLQELWDLAQAIEARVSPDRKQRAEKIDAHVVALTQKAEKLLANSAIDITTAGSGTKEEKIAKLMAEIKSFNAEGSTLKETTEDGRADLPEHYYMVETNARYEQVNKLVAEIVAERIHHRLVPILDMVQERVKAAHILVLHTEPGSIEQEIAHVISSLTEMVNLAAKVSKDGSGTFLIESSNLRNARELELRVNALIKAHGEKRAVDAKQIAEANAKTAEEFAQLMSELNSKIAKLKIEPNMQANQRLAKGRIAHALAMLNNQGEFIKRITDDANLNGRVALGDGLLMRVARERVQQITADIKSLRTTVVMDKPPQARYVEVVAKPKQTRVAVSLKPGVPEDLYAIQDRLERV